MSVLDFLSSPVLWVGLFFIGLFAFEYWRWKRRRESFRAFVKKYDLMEGVGWGSAPDPEIRGIFFKAYYPRTMEGVFRDTRVVAFEYAIGVGKWQRRGSGAGVQRQVLEPHTLFRNLWVRKKAGWTFAFTDPYSPSMWPRLSVPELEEIWHKLLTAPAVEPVLPLPVPDSKPGEVHIKPRRFGSEP